MMFLYNVIITLGKLTHSIPMYLYSQTMLKHELVAV